MKIYSLQFFGIILIGLCLLLTSCETSHHISKGRYSSADKRQKADSRHTEDKGYYFPKDKKEIKNESSFLATADIRKNIVNKAITYQGTSYRPGGKSPLTGFDCSGFTRFIFGESGINLAGSSDNLAKIGKHKSRGDLLPGDLVFFGNEDRISHVAIVSDNRNDKLEVVHATTSSGVKLEVISGHNYWESRFLFGKDIISK